MTKWKVSRYLKSGEKQGEYIIHASSIQEACKMEGHTMTLEEIGQYNYGVRFFGEKHAGYSFYQKFSDCLSENKVQKVWIYPKN